MNKKFLSERDICTKYITPSLEAAGWDRMKQIREKIPFTAGRVIIRGRLLTRGKVKRAHNILITAFGNNSGLRFAIPYFHNGQSHDYIPDFLVRLKNDSLQEHLIILETKSFDFREEVKKAAAERWTKAENEDGRFGCWQYAVAHKPAEVVKKVDEALGRGIELPR